MRAFDFSQNKIKRLIIKINSPEKIKDFLERIDKLSKHKKEFFLNALKETPNPKEDPNEIVRINLDDYLNGWNLYGYDQKPISPKALIKYHKIGYTSKEINYFTWDINIINPEKKTLIKSRTRSLEYYDLLSNVALNKSKKIEMPNNDIILFPYEKETELITTEIFQENFLERFLDFIIMWYSKGLWLNHFNTYSIRFYNGQFFIHDPDIFYIQKDNFNIMDINNQNEFLINYMDYKLRAKSTIYTIKNPKDLSDEVLDYIYWNYYFLEGIAQITLKRIQDKNLSCYSINYI